MSDNVSLEMAKRLKEAGYPQGVSNLCYVSGELITNIVFSIKHEQFDAPCTGELLQTLPSDIRIIKDCEDDAENPWNIYYPPEVFSCQRFNSLADAAANMWLMLKKGKYL